MLAWLPGPWTARIRTTLGSVGAAQAGSPRLSPVLIYVFHISSLPPALREEVKGGNGVHNSDLYNLLAALVKGFWAKRWKLMTAVSLCISYTTNSFF